MKETKYLILFAFIAALTSCGGAEERKDVYMNKAKSSIQTEDFDKARIELKNVMQIDPKDTEAIYLLGTVYEKQKEIAKAYASYRKVEEMAPDNFANQAKIGLFNLVYANDMKKAQEKIDYILARDSKNIDGLLLKATMSFKKDDLSEAISIASTANKRDPGHVDTAAFLTTLLAKNKDVDGAIGVIESALTIHPSNVQLNRLHALLLTENKEYERAEKIYTDFLEKHPEASSSYYNLAAFYNQTGDVAKAKSILKNAIDNAPKDVGRYLTYIKYVRGEEGSSQAILDLSEFVKERPELGRLRNALGELQILDSNKPAAIETYKTTISDFPEEVAGVDARMSLAAIYISDGDYAASEEIVKDALNISPNDPNVNFLHAKLSLRNKDVESAIIALRIVIKDLPENIQAHILLAEAFASQGKDEQAKSILTKAYDSNRGNPAGLLILSRYTLTRDIGLAEKVIDSYNKLKPSDYEGMSIKAGVLNQRKDYKEAFEIADLIMSSYPDKPNGYLQVLPYYSDQKDFSHVRSVLESGYLNVKDNKKILTLLVSLNVRDKKYKLVEDRLRAEIKSSPEDVDYKLLLAKVYKAKNDLKKTKTELNKIIADHPEVEDAYILLSDILAYEKDAENLKTVLLKGRQDATPSVRISLKLAAFYERRREFRESISVYKELHAKYPENLIIINNLASLLSDHPEGETDLAIARDLADKLSDSEIPVFLDTVGWVYYKSKDYANAIKFLTKVIDKEPEINVFNYHLGMSYARSNDAAMAKKYLEKSLENDVDFEGREQAEKELMNL